MNKQSNTLKASLSLLFILVFPSLKECYADGESSCRQSENVIVIANSKIPITTDRLKKNISFHNDLTIGDKEDDKNSLFGSQIMINADDDGNIYVTDWAEKTGSVQ